MAFWRYGWQTHIWPAEVVTHCDYRSLIGLAMVAYAVYIKDAILRNDYKQALIQCADAYSLISLDKEKRASIRNKEAKARIAELPRIVLSEKGKKAVSNRTDQQQKYGWIEHCKTVVNSGAAIANLDDLLSVAGYDPDVLKITPRTLKAWAKEAGIAFKAGRPRNNHA